MKQPCCGRNQSAKRLSQDTKLIGALHGRLQEHVSLYNIDSYTEFMDEKGVGDDLDLRLSNQGGILTV